MVQVKGVVTFSVDDAKGFHWEKTGDFGVVGVGKKQFINKQEVEPDIEVDFTVTTLDQLAFLVATQLLIIKKAYPEIAEKAIALYEKGKLTP